MPKSVMLTHANVGANVSQNIHPGSSTNQMATGKNTQNTCNYLNNFMTNTGKKILFNFFKRSTSRNAHLPVAILSLLRSDWNIEHWLWFGSQNGDSAPF
jgi:hypothetical protein